MEVVHAQFGDTLLTSEERMAVADGQFFPPGHIDHGVQFYPVEESIPGVIGVWQAGVVEAGGGEEDGGVGANVEAVGVEDADHVSRSDVIGAVRAGERRVLEAGGEREGFEVLDDGVVRVGCFDFEDGGVREDERAFGEGNGGEDSEAFSWGWGDGVGA